MSSATHALPHHHLEINPKSKIAIVATRWNEHIIEKLVDGASTILQQYIEAEGIKIAYVPGSFELINACAVLQSKNYFDSIIAIGCVIRGDTPHFDYICQGVTQEIAHLNTNLQCPIIFGLLTTNNEQQALDRAGGSLGNKGEEFALTAIEMTKYAQLNRISEDHFAYSTTHESLEVYKK